MSDHYVSHTLSSGDYVRTKFECRAGDNAPCRTWCDTCEKEQREQCECSGLDREPNLIGGHPCSIVVFLEHAPEEAYDGLDQPVRGPDPQPITATWEGDYYVWDYAT